jgi:hypothetical protein
LLKDELNLEKLSRSTVWRCYKEFGAKYVKPKIVYKSKMEREALICQQQQHFSQEIIRIIMHCKQVEIVYVDETSFNLWQTPSRVWLKPGMRVDMPNQRGRSITMIGAVSTQRGLFHAHTFAESNTTETFVKFLVTLRQKCEGRDCVVVMDNLSVHKTVAVRELFNKRFTQMFLPPHSCELNPIEKVWNVIKNQWRRESYLVLKDFSNTELLI